MDRRLEKLRALLQREKLDGLLVTNDQNRYYISSFSGSAGALVVTAEHAILLSDFRYQDQVAREAPAWEFRLIKPLEMPEDKLVAAVVSELGLGALGFEAGHVTVARHRVLGDALASAVSTLEFRPTEGLIEELRTVKDQHELAVLERAIAITDQAFAAIRPLLRPEMRERDVAWELEKAMRIAGADGLAFPVIVAAGANSARPHARAGDDQLGTGRPVVMDFGARLDGYHADMTRTVILGEADTQFTTIYDIVRDAQEHARHHVRAGMSGKEADALARDKIVAAGYGDNFGHGLGHGVGLVIHEQPGLRTSNEEPLPAGGVCSIEPGIYLSDWGGVRIEDLVVLEDGGARTLTGSSKDPLVLLT